MLLKSIEGITVGELMEALKDIPKDTVICRELLTENVPVKVIRECTYSKHYIGQPSETYNGILIN